MRKIFKCGLVILWLIFGGIVFGGIRATTPALWVVTIPDVAWDFLLSISGANCCESVADVEWFVSFCFGFVFSIIILVVFVVIGKWIKNPRRQMIDAVPTNSVLPEISRHALEAMMAGRALENVHLPAEEGVFAVEIRTRLVR